MDKYEAFLVKIHELLGNSCEPNAARPLAVQKLVSGACENELDVLTTALEVREIITPKLKEIESHLKLSKIAKDNPISFCDLYEFSQKLAPYVRAPPEYSDYCGTELSSVPGYFFPCPDLSMISRGSLAASSKYNPQVRCLPPSLEVAPVSADTYKLVITASHDNVTIKYRINYDSFTEYDKDNPPLLSARGSYTVFAYCLVEGHLPSVVQQNHFNLTVMSQSDSKNAAVHDNQDNDKSMTDATSQFEIPSLFLDEESSSDDEW